jgi:outer membrane protein
VPELDFSYFLNKSFALELILATATHSVGAYDTAVGNLNLGNVSLLPPTLLAQYHHEFGKFKPYVGAGLNYTVFYGADSGSDEIKSISYTNSLGYAFQVGGDYQIGDNLYLNFDIKKLYLSTDVEAITVANAKVKTQVNINPLIVGLGLGYRF